MRNTFAIFFAALIFSGGCLAPSSGGKLKEYSETRELIGTFITVTVYAGGESAASEAINASFAEMTRLGEDLSHYSTTNKVHELNTEGFEHPVLLTPDLAVVLNAFLYYSNLSSGAFDITVNPLVLMWEEMKDTNVYPTEEEIEETKARVGYPYLKISGNSAQFTKPNMSITLGAIAKGYIVDRGLEELKRCGIKHALINAGGQVGVFGGKPDGSPWTIALRNPRNASDYITLINLTDGAVATSGDYERYYTPDMKVHHIMDPHTGYSATSLISATIIAENGTHADALSTTVFVLGPEEGIKLAESLPGVQALVITENKTIIKTKGFRF